MLLHFPESDNFPEHGDVEKEDFPDDLVGMSLLCPDIVSDCGDRGLFVQSDDS